MSTESSLTKLPLRLKPAPPTRLKLTELRIANLAMPQAGVAYIYDSVTALCQHWKVDDEQPSP
jgi:hypothetical protein